MKYFIVKLDEELFVGEFDSKESAVKCLRYLEEVNPNADYKLSMEVEIDHASS